MNIFERRRARAATAIPPEEAAATAATPDEAAIAGEATAATPDEAAIAGEAAADNTGIFGALAVPDFRALWLGSLVSNVGTWMQQIGSGWLVLQLTDSPFWLGLVSFAAALPILLFSLPAGVMADRIDRRRLLLGTQTIAGLLALTLAILTATGVVRIGYVLVITLLSGTVMAFHMPTWQTMIPDIVGKARLMNAVGLNSAAFNGAAVAGPALAGVILAAFGPAACFAINAASYLAVIAALLMIRTRSVGRADGGQTGMLESVGTGLRFIRGRRLILAFFALAAIVSLAARPYLQLLPVFARDVLGGDERLYGTLMAANGTGALAGALLTAAFARVPRKGLALLGSVGTFAIGLIAFALIPRAPVALALLVLIGGATTLFMSATNTVIQSLAPDDVRGRVLSVWSMIAAGVMPLGSLVLGGLASLTGQVAYVIVGGASVALAAALIIGIVARDPRRANSDPGERVAAGQTPSIGGRA
ncbi:MAG TPA: MFS transporter [Thermomicrobiales bacterium]|jgi:MFS family permease